MALANPVVLDIETGELFLTETFVSKSARLEGFGYMVSAVFSTDDRYLYYTVCANDGKGLHRYDFQTGNAEECYIGDEPYDYEPIYFLSNGTIMTSKERRYDPTGGILYYSETDGKWAARIESFRWEYAFRGVKLYQREGSDHLIVSGKNINGGFDGTPMPAFLSFYKTKEEIKDDGRYRCIDVDSGQIVEPEEDYLKAYEHAVQNSFMSDAPDLNSDEEKEVSRTHYATWISAISMSPDGNYALVLYYGMDREYNHVHKLVLIRLEDQKSVEVTGLNMDNLNYGGDAWKHYAPIIGWEGEYIFVSETSGIHYYTINE